VEINICIDGVEKKLDVEKKGELYRFVIDGKEYEVRAQSLANGAFTYFVDNRSHVALLTKGEGGTHIAVDGRSFLIENGEDNGNHGGARGAAAHADGKVESPMPGNIIAIPVKEGETVEINQAVVVIESMKMQNEITSPVNGEVAKINCSVGDQVNFGDVLVEITPQE
jgi:acetyl-CoA/propionyl-CoA carboxylase biotin carboxyl carrier protein